MYPHPSLLLVSSFLTGTFDPAVKGPDIVLSSQNMAATNNNATTSNLEGVRTTSHHSSGKYYFEVTNTSPIHGDSGFLMVGLCTASSNLTTPGNFIGSGGDGIQSCAYWDDGSGYTYQGLNHGNSPVFSNTSSTPHTVCIAADLDHGEIWATLAGSSNWNLASADPAANSGGYTIPMSGEVYAAVSMAGKLSSSPMSVTINLGGSPWAGTPPAGFQPWG